jgi:hypothetical protein
MFKPKNPCQSCGMPLSRDPQGGGTHQDGTLHKEYCSYCYRAGTFTEPDITMVEMMDKVQGKLKEMWIPPFIGKYFTRSIPQLKRWRNR